MDRARALRLTSRFKLLRPLRNRDFALLWSAMAISLLGDGIYFVALPWQVYQLRNVPSALSMVGVAWTVPMVLLLVFSGVLSDRFRRNHMMIVGDLIRAFAMAVLGALSLAGVLELWHVVVLVALYGVGDALFMPAFTAVIPDLVPRDMLVEANSLGEVMQPVALRFVGPAIGGLIVATMGAGEAFVVDALSFAVSAAVVLRIKARPVAKEKRASALKEVLEGIRYVRSQPWLWATMLAGAFAMLVFWGPYEVLVPFVIKNRYGGGAGDFGTVLAMGGVGAVAASLAMSQRGLPRRHITFMYVAWSICMLTVAAYGIAHATWQAMIASFFVGGLASMGQIVWGTLQHRLVPTELLGRVSSLDWFTVTATVPLSFALTGPLASWVGEARALVMAGLLGFAVHLAFLALPHVTDVERLEEPPEAVRVA